jgi:hypothetical protein
MSCGTPGVLIPVFSLIKPAFAMLRDAPRFRDAAMKVVSPEGVCRN